MARPTPVPEFIDPVFTKTSPKRSFSLNRKRAFWLVFAKTGSIISGTGVESDLWPNSLWAGLQYAIDTIPNPCLISLDNTVKFRYTHDMFWLVRVRGIKAYFPVFFYSGPFFLCFVR